MIRSIGAPFAEAQCFTIGAEAGVTIVLLPTPAPTGAVTCLGRQLLTDLSPRSVHAIAHESGMLSSYLTERGPGQGGAVGKDVTGIPLAGM